MTNLIADWYRALGPDTPDAEWDEGARAYRVPEAQEAEAPAVRKLPQHQADALAAQAEADQRLTALQAEAVPEDDPRFMEALADYRDAMVPLGPDSVAYVALQKGAKVSAYLTEPEAAEPQQEPRRLLVVTGPDNIPQAWMDAPEAS